MAAAWCRALARCVAILSLALAGSAGAQTSVPDVVGVASDGTGAQLYFECSGSPSCTGQFAVVSQEAGCSNPVGVAGSIQITVPDLSKPGPVSGSGALVADWSSQHNADGTCTPNGSGAATNAISFSGTSDGVTASVTFTITGSDGTVHQAAGTLVRPSSTYGSAQVTGSIAGPTNGGGKVAISFSCTGSPLCAGSYSGIMQDDGCSNSFAVSGSITLTGFDLASSNLSGSAVLGNGNTHDQQNADGTCSIKSATDLSVTYTGTFDGSGGTLVFTGTDSNGTSVSVPGSFTVTGISNPPPPPPSSTPPFTISVDKNINATTASATAKIQPPAADVGKTVSFYVFAFAPRNLVKSAARLATKDDSGGCELAQLDPATGQLRAASASNLTAALTGTLTSQGQSVTILNGASTPSIAGATFFVGYGADPSTMISNGVNANAVQIPGSQQCPAVFPKLPGALSGLWWGGAQESGWGVHFTERHDKIFAAFYTYDGSGNAKWYVASSCQLPGSAVTSGRCTGDLYEVSATPLFGIAPSGSLNAPSKAGTLQVDFADPSHATMSYTVGSVSRTVAIMRQVFASGATPPTIDYTDLWFAGAQGAGWGMAISQEYGVMFLAWFVYDASGKPVWYVSSNCAVTASGNGCSGPLYQVTGPPFGTSFDPAQVYVAQAGTVSATFTDPNNGTITYTVNGVSSSKAITRQVF